MAKHKESPQLALRVAKVRVFVQIRTDKEKKGHLLKLLVCPPDLVAKGGRPPAVEKCKYLFTALKEIW